MYVGNIDLLSQTDVSNFSTSITAITGNLTISGADIVNLNALANLTSVSGKVFIYQNPLLSSLTGLNSLAVVGGQLDVILCNALTKWPEWSHLNRFVDCGGEQQSDKYRCFEQSEFRDQFPRNPKQFVIRNGSEIKVQIVDSPRRG